MCLRCEYHFLPQDGTKSAFLYHWPLDASVQTQVSEGASSQDPELQVVTAGQGDQSSQPSLAGNGNLPPAQATKTHMPCTHSFLRFLEPSARRVRTTKYHLYVRNMCQESSGDRSSEMIFSANAPGVRAKTK